MSDEPMTDRELVDKCNELAIRFYRMNGYQVDPTYKMYEATHPQEVGAWNMAVEAFDFVNGSDVENALDCLEDD